MSWPLVTIKEVAKVVTGKTPSTVDDQNFGGDIPFVTPAELGMETYVTSAPRTLSAKGASAIKLVPKNAVMVCCIGSLGKMAIAGTPVATNQQINSVIFDENKVDAKYGFYALQLLKPKMEAMAPSTTVAIVNKGNFEAMQIPLPPLPEQKRIAAILDKADAIRRKRQQAIQLADDFLRAVFLDMFGDPVTNPKGWEVSTLGELCAKITDGEHGTVKRLDSGKLYLMARNIDRKGNLDLSAISFIGEEDHQRIYKRCDPEKGDVLLVCVGATIGKALIVPDMGEFSLARSVALLKPGKRVVSEYLLSLINTEALQRQFISSGNSSAQAGLYLGKIKEISVPVPDLAEQLRFGEFVAFVKAKFSSKVVGENSESDFVLSLTQKAFSGQL